MFRWGRVAVHTAVDQGASQVKFGWDHFIYVSASKFEQRWQSCINVVRGSSQLRCHRLASLGHARAPGPASYPRRSSRPFVPDQPLPVGLPSILMLHAEIEILNSSNENIPLLQLIDIHANVVTGASLHRESYPKSPCGFSVS